MILVKKRNGKLEELDVNKINRCVERACVGIEDVSASEIILDAELSFYNKITTSEIDEALILTAKSKIEKDPNYSYVSARLLLNTLYKEVFKEGVDSDIFSMLYKKSFISNLKYLVKQDILSDRILELYNLKELASYLVPDRDLKFSFFGLKTLADRYFLRYDGKVLESPQAFFMRVAMGLCLEEDDPMFRVRELYNKMSMFKFIPSSPTLFNSGTIRSQLSSCYLNCFEDSIDGIFEGYWQEARKSKYAGGLGLSVTNLRGTGSFIKGTNGPSSGLIPWLKIMDSLCVAVDQGGKRPGACCTYLEPWHIDVEEFLEIRKNTGDENRRVHQLNTALWISDLFMEKVSKNEDWYLFSPNEVSDLHESYGKDFEDRYNKYCLEAETGNITRFKKLNAKDLWKKALSMLFETGHPWITFKDAGNIRYPLKDEGIIHSSNLCTEIFEHTKHSKYDRGEKIETGVTAVCNLSSINLKEHLKDGDLDYEDLKDTIRVQMRALDNVIDLNFYPTKEAENSKPHRFVGAGVMGWMDLIHYKKLVYDSQDVIEFCDEIQEFISYHSIKESINLAKERGPFDTYNNSEWAKGKLPLDTYVELMESRGMDHNMCEEYNTRYSQDWDSLREDLLKYGIRNSVTQATAPNATSAMILNAEACIEPDYKILYVKGTKSGNAIFINEWFVKEIKELGLWNDTLINDLKINDGSIQNIEYLPAKLKDRFKTAFEFNPLALIACTARRQKWIDQAISHNVYCAVPKGKVLNDIYMYAWRSGLKSTYYLRTLGATSVENVDIKKNVNIDTPEPEPEPEPEPLNNSSEIPVCNLDEGCESCQ